MSENIQVGTGIGEIQNNHGTINISTNQKNDEFKVRISFESIKGNIFTLDALGQAFQNCGKEWIRLKNKEDFEKIYELDYEIRKNFEKIYQDGKACADEVGIMLCSINHDITTFPSLTLTIQKMEKYWINKDRIDEYQNILKKSKYLFAIRDQQLYAINWMIRLFEQQIELLAEVYRILHMLKSSDLYKKENHIEDNLIDTKNAPKQIKNSIWLKEHSIRGLIMMMILVVFYNLSVISEYVKQNFGIQIFKIEATQEEKIKMKHIFQSGDSFVSLWNEKRDYKSVEISGNRNALQEHFSALNFDGNKLFLETKNPMDWLKNYNDMRSSFEGYIDRNFPKYRSLYDAGVNLSAYIKSGEVICLEDFIKNWKKFQENSNLSTPNFDISKIKSTNDAIKIYLEIQKWLNK